MEKQMIPYSEYDNYIITKEDLEVIEEFSLSSEEFMSFESDKDIWNFEYFDNENKYNIIGYNISINWYDIFVYKNGEPYVSFISKKEIKSFLGVEIMNILLEKERYFKENIEKSEVLLLLETFAYSTFFYSRAYECECEKKLTTGYVFMVTL